MGIAPLALAADNFSVRETGPQTTSTRSSIPADLRPGGSFDRYVADLAVKDQFSGTFLLARAGRPVLCRAYGMANKTTKIPNRIGTRYALASVTKLFTAVAIHQLAQQGKVRYGAKLGTYLGGFATEVADKVRVHHLLTHTSGLGDVLQMPGYEEAAKTWDSAAEVFDGTLEFSRRSTLAFAPGAGWSYSNTGFFLLGAIVAAASGESYFDYVQKNVFGAAGMRSSSFVTKPQWRTDPGVAHPYYQKEGSSEWTDGVELYPFIGLPPGNSFATCADMARFARALLDDELLESPYTDLMVGPKVMPMGGGGGGGGGTPQPSEGQPPPGQMPREVFFGYGPAVTLFGDQWIYGHGGGGNWGASTSIEIYPGSGWVVVILSNYSTDAGGVGAMSTEARRLILAN